jgi:hypothetical protein
MKDFSKELRSGNFVNLFKGVSDEGAEYEFYEMTPFDIYKVSESECDDIEPIPITKETIEKYIDWSFEYGFNKSVVEKEYWTEYHFLMENVIEGSSDFEIIISESKEHSELSEITYYIDDNQLELGLDDTLHNLQNLFFISTGQELPIKQNIL